MKKLRFVSSLLTVLLFFLIGFGLFLWGIIAPDREISAWERRKLAQTPEFTVDSLIDGQYFPSLEEYVADQFPLRDSFRTLNSTFRTDILRQEDVNDLYEENGYLFKSDFPLSEKNVARFAAKTNSLYETYLKGKIDRYFVCAVPDKSAFDSGTHPKSDASRIQELFYSQVVDAVPIDIFPALQLSSYYKTDSHWSQDQLLPVMEIFADAMEFESSFPAYESHALSPFYGVYYGQLALNTAPDTLVYLTSPAIEAASVENLQSSWDQVYDPSEFEDTVGDPYDVFLSGPTPLTTVTSPNSATEKELVIFRDSYGSSIAPLFLEEYRRVFLVDLRYLGSELLPEYIDFTGKDVLVLYSTTVLNSSIILK